MPISSNTHTEVKVKKGGDGYDDDHTGGSFSKLLRRVYSLEDMLKKLRWERNAVRTVANGEISQAGTVGEFQMPLHYPRYSKADYESMAESKLDMLLREYGLNIKGDVEYKRDFAIGAFLWPDQCL